MLHTMYLMKTPQPTTDEQAQKPVAALFDSTVEVATEPTAGGIGAKQSAAKGTAGGPAVPIRYEASGLLPDEKVAAPSHVLLIDEIVSSLYLFGLLRLPSFLAAMFSTQVAKCETVVLLHPSKLFQMWIGMDLLGGQQVEIQGPSNVLFKVDLPAGQKFRAVMTLLPVSSSAHPRLSCCAISPSASCWWSSLQPASCGRVALHTTRWGGMLARWNRSGNRCGSEPSQQAAFRTGPPGCSCTS